MLPPMKRPSSRKNEADEDGEPETKKRPAASSGSMNKAINALKHGLKSSSSKKDEDDNDEESVGDDAEESHLRDKGKNLKFNSMRRSLPAHIIHLYDTEALSKPSPREFRTQVINQLFTKLKNGRYSLNAEKPMFQEAKKLYERKYGKDSETGLPKSVLKGLYFQNSESAFQEAISSGDVYVMNSEDGVEFFGFRKIEAGRERGTTREQSVLKEKKITADQSNCLEDLLEQLNWSFNWKKTDSKSMVEGEKLPESVLKLLTQAITSETKLSGDAFKLLKKIGDDGGADYKGLKLLYTESQTHLSSRTSRSFLARRTPL
ncbi:unnamed protein product [Durusdinium trenchii]|uniref:Uncharacterized protein n=1 Tax=Durusdinium trenchii TaxID=1381693 RepID=A0ABP0QTD0_9DINO